MKIGIPRGLLSSVYLDVLLPYFDALGVESVVSPPTTKKILLRGTELAPSESCLALKIYLGHIDELIGSCDAILAVRQTGVGRYGTHCSRYKATYELARNIFRKRDVSFIELAVDLSQRDGLGRALIRMGRDTLGKPKGWCQRAYRQASAQAKSERAAAYHRQEILLTQPGPKILVSAHSYHQQDALVGRIVEDKLSALGVIPILSTLVPASPERSREISPKIPWLQSAEQSGAFMQVRDRIDGAVFLSSFPCGPDSMVNELIARREERVPILLLSMDGQDEGERLDVRLESFVDVILSRRKEPPCVT